MFRKRHRSLKRPAIAGVAILGIFGLWWATWGGGAEPVTDRPLTRTTEQATPHSQVPPPEPAFSAPVAAAAEPTYPPPTVISFGRALDAGVSKPEGPPPSVEPSEPVRPVSTLTDAPEPNPAAPSQPEPARATALQTPPPLVAPTTSPSLQSLPSDLQSMVSLGRQKLAAEPVAARQLLARALIDPRTPEPERSVLRDELTRLNEDLVFSPRIVKDDPFVGVYAVQSGDALEKIARKENLATHWRLIQRVNRLANADRIQLNQKLKLVKGPFHAVVIKSAFRMDLYMGDAARPQDWVYARSFRVGLGEGGSTPTGDFLVKRGSKLENPYWTNPRTGERFSKDDPKNPIGERWIGLEGIGESAASTGYGVHGTVDPESIGREMSMGCVRLGSEDVELVYDLLGEGASVVRIVP